MKETTDFIPAADQRRDFNKQLCALVKVQVVDEITDVEGNIMGDIVNKGVEKWVYMAKDSRNMKIHLKNNLPAKIMFRDYGINGLVSNRIYEIVINVPNKPTPSATGQLHMSITPANALITIWNEESQRQVYKPDDNGSFKIDLPYGRYQYEVKANDQQKKEGSLFISDETSMVTVNFSSVPKEIAKPKPLNKSFKVKYEGVTFKCKAKKGYITITGFDTDAGNVTIPGKVEFEGNFYPVREVDTFINGNNYSATKLVIEEGVEQIAKFAFVEFRKLVDVTIPSTIREIGKNAFRDNSGMHFNTPSNISEYDLRDGRAIQVR